MFKQMQSFRLSLKKLAEDTSERLEIRVPTKIWTPKKSNSLAELFFFFFSTGDGTHGLMQAKHALYY
jgi:hypothetical protein